MLGQRSRIGHSDVAVRIDLGLHGPLAECRARVRLVPPKDMRRGSTPPRSVELSARRSSAPLSSGSADARCCQPRRAGECQQRGPGQGRWRRPVAHGKRLRPDLGHFFSSARDLATVAASTHGRSTCWSARPRCAWRGTVARRPAAGSASSIGRRTIGPNSSPWAARWPGRIVRAAGLQRGPAGRDRDTAGATSHQPSRV